MEGIRHNRPGQSPPRRSSPQFMIYGLKVDIMSCTDDKLGASYSFVDFLWEEFLLLRFMFWKSVPIEALKYAVCIALHVLCTLGLTRTTLPANNSNELVSMSGLDCLEECFNIIRYVLRNSCWLTSEVSIARIASMHWVLPASSLSRLDLIVCISLCCSRCWNTYKKFQKHS